MFRKSFSSHHSEGLVANLSLMKDLVCYKDIGESLKIYGVISNEEHECFLQIADSQGNTCTIEKLVETLETRKNSTENLVAALQVNDYRWLANHIQTNKEKNANKGSNNNNGVNNKMSYMKRNMRQSFRKATHLKRKKLRFGEKPRPSSEILHATYRDNATLDTADVLDLKSPRPQRCHSTTEIETNVCSSLNDLTITRDVDEPTKISENPKSLQKSSKWYNFEENANISQLKFIKDGGGIKKSDKMIESRVVKATFESPEEKRQFVQNVEDNLEFLDSPVTNRGHWFSKNSFSKWIHGKRRRWQL